MITQKVILARPDGTYIEVISSNEDSRTQRSHPSDAHRSTLQTVLDKIADFRPGPCQRPAETFAIR